MKILIYIGFTTSFRRALFRIESEEDKIEFYINNIKKEDIPYYVFREGENIFLVYEIKNINDECTDEITIQLPVNETANKKMGKVIGVCF